jgi:hypothetical protein
MAHKSPAAAPPESLLTEVLRKRAGAGRTVPMTH